MNVLAKLSVSDVALIATWLVFVWALISECGKPVIGWLPAGRRRGKFPEVADGETLEVMLYRKTVASGFSIRICVNRERLLECWDEYDWYILVETHREAELAENHTLEFAP